jgi:membrane dipeptidase
MFTFLAHEDVPVDVSNRRLNGETHVMKRIHIPRYRQSGVKFAVMATGGDQLRPFGKLSIGFRTQMLGAAKFIDDMIAEEEESSDELKIVKNANDFTEVLNSDKFGVILHFEGGMPLDGNLFMLRSFYRLGLRSMQLGWYFRNELADSGSEANPGGLSHFGRQVVSEMNRLGMVIDVSHLSEPSVKDILSISKDPIMASHSNAKAIWNHNRNISDEIAKEIAAKGGLVGVALYPPIVCKGNPTMDDVLGHFDHFSKLIGVDHLAVGPDYSDFAPELLLGEVMTKTGPLSVVFPPGLETVLELPNLIQGLKGRGYKQDEIELIMGGNVLRLFQAVLRE